MARFFRIHLAIGIARMGNSPSHFIGPETPAVPANSDDGVNFKSFRDSQGRILRQGARFRVFEYTKDASGILSNPREVIVGTDVVATRMNFLFFCSTWKSGWLGRRFSISALVPEHWLYMLWAIFRRLWPTSR